MLNTEQTKGQTVFQHGQSVQTHFMQFVDHLKTKSTLPDWRMPSWASTHTQFLLDNLHSLEVIAAYTLYHDCGKPFCRTVDEDGRVHFPDHADVSRRVYLAATGDAVVAGLIGWDMAIHLSSAEEIEMRLKSMWTTADAVTLLIAALSEVHSNAKMFGGIESTSFKMKWKTIEKRGKQICKFYMP